MSNQVDFLRNIRTDGQMPDYTRMVRMEYFTDTTGLGFNVNPATIYKINVPGYFYWESCWSGWTDETDSVLMAASHPAYLYSNQYMNSGTPYVTNVSYPKNELNYIHG